MDQDRQWSDTLDYIKSRVSAGNFRTWFSHTKLGQVAGTELTILVPSAFIKNQLLDRYEKLIQEATQTIWQKNLQINYQIDSNLLVKGTASTQEVEEVLQLQTPPTRQASSSLNPRYTLDSFVVGLTNNLAYAAAQAVVQNPGISYNPLFIYGPSGVGKTHLMQAIGNELLKKNSDLRVTFAPSERFMNDFVTSIQTKKTPEFRSRYRSADILLIDDIQFISGKDSTQEEFFHTYNEIYTKNCQVILTSDKPPQDIDKLEDRLRSRFQGGLMVDIQLPDFDTRVAILKAKLQERGGSLPEECLNLIAGQVHSNSRELEGKLIQILQMVKLSHQTPDLETISKFLGKQAAPTHRPADHKKLLNEINQYFNLKMAELIGPRRQKELVLPRQIAMYLMYDECKIPMERIGQILGGRDHTTILHGIEKIREFVGRDREVQRMVIEIKQLIES